MRKLNQLYIICLLAENPSLYLKEVRQKIHATTGITVSGSRVLSRNGKRLCKLQDKDVWNIEVHLWQTHFNILATDRLVFLDV